MEEIITSEIKNDKDMPDIFKHINATSAFKFISSCIRRLTQGKKGHEIKNPAGKHVVFDDGSWYFLGVDNDGTFTLSYFHEDADEYSELQYSLYRNGSQLVKQVLKGKKSHVRFSVDGSKHYEKSA